MFTIKFTPKGEQDFRKLTLSNQRRISQKLTSNASLPDPLVRAKPLINLPPATHRFRVGKYRVFFYIQEHTIFVERIESRGRAYRQR
jgi:mRNA-degrading endonuclease RelE of RelBE toxin-antitoxin system